MADRLNQICQKNFVIARHSLPRLFGGSNLKTIATSERIKIASQAEKAFSQ